MTQIFTRLIKQFLSKNQQNVSNTQRYQSLFRKAKAKEHNSPYIIVRANKDDHPTILKLMQDTYFKEEPLHYSLKITKNAVLDERALNAMAQGMTVVARCKYNGSIVGACINQAAHRWDPDMAEKFACSVRCPKVRKLELFFAHLQRLPNVWERYEVDKVFEIECVFIHKEHRKNKLATRLFGESIEAAADCGYKVVRCDATSAFTEKLCNKFHMEKIAEIRYSNYLSRSLEPIFVPPHPHNSAKVYVDIDPQINKFKKSKK